MGWYCIMIDSFKNNWSLLYFTLSAKLQEKRKKEEEKKQQEEEMVG